MKYKVKINSKPEFYDVIKARNVAEAKRLATRNAVLSGVKVLYSDEIEVIEVE